MRLYSRDDVWGAAKLQRMVVQAVAEGFRPLRPQAGITTVHHSVAGGGALRHAADPAGRAGAAEGRPGFSIRLEFQVSTVNIGIVQPPLLQRRGGVDYAAPDRGGRHFRGFN